MKRLVLVGAGHAHLEVLLRLARDPMPGVDVTLVNPAPLASYTGMVPGYLAGRYEPGDITVALEPLCLRAGARLVVGEATGVDAASRSVATTAGAFAFDAASVDVGGEPARLREVPGAAVHAIALRPLSNAAVVRQRVLALAGAPCVVVGAGAAGVEVALALRVHAPVTLVEAEDDLLAGYPPRARRLARAILARRGVRLALGRRVARVEADAVLLDDGTRLASALTVWLAGTAAPALVAESRLACDDAGFLRVDDTLRAADGAPVWGAGDCVTIVGHPLPRAGVHAVRAAPTLAHNLRAFLLGGTARHWSPRREVLALLDTSDGRALLRWRGLALHGRAAGWLKTRIDRGWVGKFR